MGNCCSNSSSSGASGEIVARDPSEEYVPDDFQGDPPPVSRLTPGAHSTLRPIHDKIMSEAPAELAKRGLNAVMELVQVKDAPRPAIFWRIIVLQGEEDEDVHEKIVEVKDDLEAWVKYVYNTELESRPQCVRWFVVKR